MMKKLRGLDEDSYIMDCNKLKEYLEKERTFKGLLWSLENY